MSESRFADEGTLAYIAELEADLHSTHARVVQNGKAVQEAERKLAVSREAIQQTIAENERLRQVCRDAYEVWAGGEGIPEPVTCAEAYLYKLLIQMRDEVKKGL